MRLHELAQLVGLSPGSLKWHMAVLQRTGFVTEHKGGPARFYSARDAFPELRAILPILAGIRSNQRKETLLRLATEPGPMTTTSMSAALGVTPGSARNGLDFLVAQGLATKGQAGPAATYLISPLGRRVVAWLNKG